MTRPILLLACCLLAGCEVHSMVKQEHPVIPAVACPKWTKGAAPIVVIETSSSDTICFMERPK